VAIGTLVHCDEGAALFVLDIGGRQYSVRLAHCEGGTAGKLRDRLGCSLSILSLDAGKPWRVAVVPEGTGQNKDALDAADAAAPSPIDNVAGAPLTDHQALRRIRDLAAEAWRYAHHTPLADENRALGLAIFIGRIADSAWAARLPEDDETDRSGFDRYSG